jgi:hypothetical protein
MRDVNFLYTDFAGQIDLIFVRYSTTKNGIPSNNEFRFQGNVWESTPNAFVSIFS